MRILYLATRVCWPVRSGAHLRDFYVALHLSKNAKLTYIGLDTGEGGTLAGGVSYDPIEAFSDAEVIRVRRQTKYTPTMMVRGLVGPKPLNLLNFDSPLFMQQVDKVLRRESFDVVQVEGVHMDAYTQRVRQLAPKALLNGDWHNVESEIMTRYTKTGPNLPRRLYAWRSVSLLRECENVYLRHCDSHTVCSEREREALLARNLNSRIEVIPNGVDIASFESTAAESAPRTTLLYVGAMDYHANIDAALYFAREAWPAIYQRRPDLTFVIVGSKPSLDIVKLGEQPGITVTGTVPDVRPYYRSALAALVPLRIGGGTRLKILEAMAAGTPVISTGIGAEGLPVQHGVDILLADSPQEMVECVLSLHPGSELWKKLTAAGRVTARPYDWNAVGDKLLRFYDGQLARVASARAQ